MTGTNVVFRDTGNLWPLVFEFENILSSVCICIYMRLSAFHSSVIRKPSNRDYRSREGLDWLHYGCGHSATTANVPPTPTTTTTSTTVTNDAMAGTHTTVFWSRYCVSCHGMPSTTTNYGYPL